MRRITESYMVACDTIRRMESASLARQLDGLVLDAAGRGFWAMYTFGYMVECCLKTAFCRLAGLDYDENVAPYVIGQFPKDYARAIGVMRRPGSMHDLLFWFDMILGEREALRKTTDREFIQDFALRLQPIAAQWKPGMRYQPSLDLGDRVRHFAAAANWVLEHRVLLWS